MDQTHERIERLERLVADLDVRVGRLEPAQCPAKAVADRPPRPEAARPAPRAPEPAAPTPVPAAFPPPAKLSDVLPFDLSREELEDLVGGRVLAWVGGLAVLLGMVFLFALAISAGWIGETARVGLGAVASGGLLALGFWLHESRARTDAALASVATGIAGLFLTVTVAAQVYDVVPQLLAVLLAVAVGAIATGLAVRWESRGIAVLGILGALIAPVLGGVAGDGGTMLILFIALASAAGVLLWLRWDWFALAAFAVATPQWIAYLVDGPPAPSQLAVLVGFGALGAVVAVGHDVRLHAKRLRSSSAYLLALSAIVVSAVGWATLSDVAGEGAGNAWLAGIAVVHIGIGLAGRPLGLSHDLRLLALVLGTVIGDVAFGLIMDGPALTIGWALTGVGFTVLMSRRRPTDAAEGVLTQVGLGGHVALSMLSAIAVSDPAQVLNGSAELSASGAAAVAALAAACLVSARIAGERNEDWRIALDSLGLAAIALLTALTLDGLQLVLAWTLEVVALAGISRRTGDPVAALGAIGFVTLAAIHALVVEAPPEALTAGLAAPAQAVVALAAVGGSLALLSAWILPEVPEVRAALTALAAVALLYLTALTLDGLPLVLAWAAEAIALAAIGRRTGDEVARLGALVFVGAAALHAVAVEAQPAGLDTGYPDQLAALAALAGVAVSLLVLALWTEPERRDLQMVLSALAALSLLYVTAVGLAGAPLAVAWTIEAAALAAIARRTGDEVAAVGSFAFVGAAALHAIVLEAPPVSLVTGLADPVDAIAAFAGVAGCLMLMGAWAAEESPDAATILRGLAALAALYLASTVVVTPFESDSAVDSALLSAHQQGQMVLSVFWALVGVGTMVLGLRRDLAIVRIAGLALLGVAVAKVFLFDLATLTAGYRVVSFIGLGLLLLGGALVWQRLRPRALADLRETPTGVR
jgi:hypothetical protein